MLKQEPERLNLLQPGEYGLFTIPAGTRAIGRRELSCRLRAKMVGHLRTNYLVLEAACAAAALTMHNLVTG